MRMLALLAGLTASSSAFAAACPSFDFDLGSTLGANIASGDTTGQVNDSGGSCAGNAASEDVAYKWTAPTTATYYITTDGSSYDTALTIQDLATCTEIDCDDDSGEGLRSYIELPATAGTEYIINVDGYSTASVGAYTLSITDTCLDSDGDGVCDTSDLCFGDDTTGDSDFDGICDDTDFTLAASFGGGQVTLSVTNAPAGANIFFLASGNGGFTCAPGGSPCVNLARPRVLGSTAANAAGEASIVVNLPANPPPTIYFEAAYTAGGGDSSNTLIF